MSDGCVEVAGEGLQTVSVPGCPMFRSVRARPLYPVQGYCVLGCSPGGFMIPSIAEFREFCTGSGFAACPWFTRAQDSLPAVPEGRGQ
jgi:hypothetical protein